MTKETGCYTSWNSGERRAGVYERGRRERVCVGLPVQHSSILYTHSGIEWDGRLTDWLALCLYISLTSSLLLSTSTHTHSLLLSLSLLIFSISLLFSIVYFNVPIRTPLNMWSALLRSTNGALIGETRISE